MATTPEKRPIAVYGAMIANLAIAASKLIVASISGSSAMLSEGIHSLADTGNELLLLLGLRRSGRPADATHPYGHGKELYFWSLIVAVVLFAVGGGMSIYEGLNHVLHPEPIKSPLWNYVVLAIAFVFEGGSFLVSVRELRKRNATAPLWQAFRWSKDPSVYTVVAEDAAALAGLVVAFAGVFLADRLGIPELDGVASLVVGAILIVVAVLLVIESRNLLIGESASPALVEDVRRIAEDDPDVLRAGYPLTMHLGPDEVLLNLDLEFRPELSGDALRTAIARIEFAIREKHPEVTRVFLESTSLARRSRTPSLRPSSSAQPVPHTS